MANPTSVGVTNQYPALLEVTATAITVVLSVQRSYSLWHLGIKNDGAADTNAIHCSISQTTPVDFEPAADYFVLDGAGHANGIIIGPGIAALNLDAAAGGPLMNIVPSEEKFGNS